MYAMNSLLDVLIVHRLDPRRKFIDTTAIKYGQAFCVLSLIKNCISKVGLFTTCAVAFISLNVSGYLRQKKTLID